MGEAVRLPFPDATFDVVLSTGLLEHFQDPSPIVREMARVLRPGGALVSLDFNRPDRAAVRGVYLAYLEAVGSAPAEFAAFIAEDRARYKRVIDSAGIRVE